MKELLNISEHSVLLDRLNKADLEIGMIEFGVRKNSFPVPSQYTVIGKFECDPLVEDPTSKKILMLDHEVVGREMLNVSKDIFSFIKALAVIDDYYMRCENNEDLYDDEILMKQTAEQAAVSAGGNEFLNFFFMFFGI